MHSFDATVPQRTNCLEDLSSVVDMALPGKMGGGRPLKLFEACAKDKTLQSERLLLSEDRGIGIDKCSLVHQTMFYLLLEG